MAHLIGSTDRLVLTGEPAWHGLGIIVKDAPTPLEALKIAGLDWEVQVEELRLANGKPTGAYANVRSDTGTVLGVTSDRYRPMQNTALAGLLHLAATEGAMPKIETAGSLRDGKTVFFLCRLAEFGVGTTGSDRTVQYLFAHNSHAADGSLSFMLTDVRVVCANTESRAMRTGSNKVSLRHTQSMVENLPELVRAVAHGRLAAEESEREARALVAKQVNSLHAREFLLFAYEECVGKIDWNPKDADGQKKRDKAARWLSEREGEWRYGSRNNVDGIGGTAWSLHQTVTDWLDHEARSRNDNRMYSNVLGLRAEQKRTVKAQALTMV